MKTAEKLREVSSTVYFMQRSSKLQREIDSIGATLVRCDALNAREVANAFSSEPLSNSDHDFDL